MSMVRAWVAAVVLCACACGSAQNAASRDPMRCERNPDCARDRKNADCWRQCNDDPECVDRCRQMQPDGLGHR
jgi:hypothetical protein